MNGTSGAAWFETALARLLTMTLIRFVSHSHAATTRGPGSTASDAWHGLLSIVTSAKPTALSWSHISVARLLRHRGFRHHDRLRLRRQQFGRQIGGRAGIQQHMVVNPQQRVDRERQPRRLQLRAVEAGTSGADEMNARQPVLGDDLRKRRLALHQFGKARAQPDRTTPRPSSARTPRDRRPRLSPAAPSAAPASARSA